MTLGWEIPKWENRTMGWAKVNQMAPNRTQKMPKGSQKGANGSHKWAKGSKQWIKSDLNSTYNQYKRQCREKDEKKEACSSIPRSVLGAIFHQKCIQKSMQKLMSKKYGHLWENAPKIMLKRDPKSMTNLWNFGTCDFLFLAKSITLKSFFYMIRGTRIPSKIHKKSMQIRCSKKVCRKHEKCQKMEPKWEPKSMKIHPKTT